MNWLIGQVNKASHRRKAGHQGHPETVQGLWRHIGCHLGAGPPDSPGTRRKEQAKVAIETLGHEGAGSSVILILARWAVGTLFTMQAGQEGHR